MISHQEGRTRTGFFQEHKRFLGQAAGIGLFALVVTGAGHWLQKNTYIPVDRADTSCSGYASEPMREKLGDYLKYMHEQEVPLNQQIDVIQDMCNIIKESPDQELNFTPLN